MYAEITKEAFKAMVKSDTPTTKVEQLELCRKYHYFSHGVALMAIEQSTNQAQYYIQDINL